MKLLTMPLKSVFFISYWFTEPRAWHGAEAIPGVEGATPVDDGAEAAGVVGVAGVWDVLSLGAPPDEREPAVAWLRELR